MNIKLLIEDQINDITLASFNKVITDENLTFAEEISFQVEVPKDEKFGDFSVNIAMKTAKKLGTNPREFAQKLIASMDFFGTYIDRAEIAGPGFINFFLDERWLGDEVCNILENKDEYGKIVLDEKKKINIEYVSANPTGPLHIGNARGGAIGDVLANIYDWAGWESSKEFYLNDAGNQIIKFGSSLDARINQIKDEGYPFPEDGYKGEDVKELARKYADEFGLSILDEDEKMRQDKLVAFSLNLNIDNMKNDLLKYGIDYDVWFKESELHKSGAVSEIIEKLSQNGATYEKDGATWFKATDYDCEKDEVLIRNNSVPTYYAADIAYHYNKLVMRGFDQSVNVWGADHHGHVHRLKMALKAIGINPDRLKVVLMQLVHLVRGSESVRMSKRAGDIVTLSDLIDEVSVDAARFIFNANNASTHMDFDLDLAVKQSNDNPVFYVQYAHARMKSILRNVTCKDVPLNLSLLNDKSEVALIKKLSSFSKEILLSAKDYDPSRMTKYGYELSTMFHSFYNACRVKNDDENLMKARLALVEACSYVLKNTLNIIGVSAPEQM